VNETPQTLRCGDREARNPRREAEGMGNDTGGVEGADSGSHQDRRRTQQQNKALHKYFRQLSEAFNEAGFSVMQVMRHDAEIPWTEELVKELIWKTVQQAMLNTDSTTDLDRKQVSEVYEVVQRHLAQTTGVHVEFPTEEGR